MARIFCPKCAWKPRPFDQWECWPGCQHQWHTFDTRGQCPKCLKQWKETQCLRCDAMSLHEDWYHDEGEDDRLRRLVEAETREEVGAR